MVAGMLGHIKLCERLCEQQTVSRRPEIGQEFNNLRFDSNFKYMFLQTKH